LFIDERFRGQGLGRKALELVEADARDAGLRGIDLNVWGRNDVARRLYRPAGFDERAVFMSKELA
jgi:ribosomal protein S18 acetylase RimI-like enzyme